MGAQPINFHYSMGFASLMWQVFIIIVVFSGIVLTPTVVAMDAVGKKGLEKNFPPPDKG